MTVSASSCTLPARTVSLKARISLCSSRIEDFAYTRFADGETRMPYSTNILAGSAPESLRAPPRPTSTVSLPERNNPLDRAEKPGQLKGVPMRPMEHGYTNRTVGDQATVVKAYNGPHPDDRRERETTVLQALRGRLPVPPVLDTDDASLTLGFVAGTHAQ